MDFNYFKNKISHIQNTQNGGLDSQFKMAPKMREKFDIDLILKRNPKKAAVLVLFYPNEHQETQFLLTLRANYNGTHSSQISFPGGKYDQNDEVLQNTALRESFEEVGINQNDVMVFKEMTDVYIPPSNFLVTPFLGILNYQPNFKTNHEVEKLIECDLDELLKDSTIANTTITTSYTNNLKVPCFKFNNNIVWGATAMMLSEIRELLISL